MPNPFGIALGSTPSLDMATYHVSFQRVPNGHPDLTSYIGTWRPGKGLVSILAMTDVFEDDTQGYSARSIYEKLKRQLERVYGPPLELEFLRPGALYSEDHEFIPSIDHGERHHMCRWNRETRARLDAGIEEITLSLLSEGYDRAKVGLQYATYQFDAHDSESESFGESSL